MNHDALRDRVRAVARANRNCDLSTIGESREGRELFLLTLSSDHASAHRRPALLITAGLDGRHWLGAETAARVAERILDEHTEMLDELTIYVIPRANPDGTELNFGPVNMGNIGTLRPVDLDRDGEVNEDGPNDLDGDGVITMMRCANPPLSDTPTHLPDPHEPRLMKTPDWSKGERATHILYTEGIDEDGDGRIAEDGPGFVDLDRNFMHLWPEHDTAGGAGPYQLSEPESLALAKFVFEHTNIAMAITYGRHDNMINVPDHRGRDTNRRIVTGIDEGDKALYDELSKLFKETTEQKRAPKEDIAGSFHAWLYAQRGVPSVATVVWGRPDVEKPKTDEEADNGEAPREEAEEPAAPAADPLAGSWSGEIALPMMEGMEDAPRRLDVTLNLEVTDGTDVAGSLTSMMGDIELSGTKDPGSPAVTLTGQMGGAVITIPATAAGDDLRAQITGPMPGAMTLNAKREGGPPDAGETGAGTPRPARKEGPADAEAAAWLEYSDSRGGVGFVEWTTFDHPQLGEVEIGGFVPGFTMNPPADELDGLAEKQAAFAIALADKRPRLSVQGPDVKRLASGLYDVRIAIVNDGWLPTRTAMGARARAMLPTVLRLSTPIDNIVTGERIDRAWRIDGLSRHDAHWILAVEDGATIEIELLDDQLGDRLIRFTADENTTVDMTDLPEDRR